MRAHEPKLGATLIRVERWNERTQAVVVDHIEAGADLEEILAEAGDMLGGIHDGHPTITLCRSDGSTLSLSSDGRCCHTERVLFEQE